MSLPIDNASLLGDFVPNVYISRITLDYGNRSTTFRGDNPHIDIPTKEQYLTSIGMTKESIEKGFGQTLTEEAYKGLYGTEKKKTDISSFSNTNPSKTNQTMIATVNLVIKDVIENKMLSGWFDEEKLKKYLNITLVQSTDLKTTAKLNSIDPRKDFSWYESTSIPNKTSLHTINLGDIYPSNGAGETSPGHQMGSTKIEYDPNRFNSYEYTTDDLGRRVYNITFSRTFTVEKSNVQHLAYFAVVNVDKKFFEESFDPPLNLDNVPDIYKHLTGKKIFEFVIKDGKTIDQASYYLDKDGKVWLGDTHIEYHIPETPELVGADNWEDFQEFLTEIEKSKLRADQLKNIQPMILKGANSTAGLAISSNKRDLVLTENKVYNTKIHDMRQKQIVEKIDIDFSQANKLFSQKRVSKEDFVKSKYYDDCAIQSDLWVSRDPTNRVNFCFALGLKMLLMKYSPYSKVYYNLTKQQKYSLYTSGLIKEISVIRKRVKAIDNTDLFDQNMPIERVATLNMESSKGRLYQHQNLSLDTSKSYSELFFTGNDNTLIDVKEGFYQYGIRYTFEDRLQALVNKKLKQLSSYLKMAEQFLSVSRQPKYYNLVSDVYTKLYKTEQTNEFYGIIPHLLSEFNELYEMMNAENSDTREKFLINLVNVSSPETGTPDGLEFVVGMVRSFYNQVSDVFSTKGIASNNESRTNTYNPSSTKSGIKDNFLRGEVFFPQIFDASDRNKGYDFLTFSGQAGMNEGADRRVGIRQISYDHLRERTLRETKKYFTDPDASITLAIDYSSQDNQVKSDLVDQRYGFLSPSFVKTPENGSLPLLPPSNTAAKEVVNYKRLNNVYLEILKEYLSDENATTVVPPDQVSNLSPTDKKQKVLLTGLLALKGCSYETSATEGVALYSTLEDSMQNLSFADFNSPETQPIVEQNQEPVLTPAMIDEPNYNDAMLFLSDADQSALTNAFFNQFSSFINSIDLMRADPEYAAFQFGKYLSKEELKKLPNSYKQLLLLSPVKDIETGKYSNENPIYFSMITDILNLFSVLLSGGSLVNLNVKSKTFGIFMHYFNLVEIEYLSGFTTGLQAPVWTRLNSDIYNDLKSANNNDGRPVLCRLKYYENQDFGVQRNSKVNLPIYDQYFILSTGEVKKFPDYKGPTGTVESFTILAKQAKTNDDLPPEYLESNGGVSKEKQGSQSLGGGFNL